MPYDPDPRVYPSRWLFQACTYSCRDQAHRLSNSESRFLMLIMNAYSNHSRITRSQREKAITIVDRILKTS